MSIMSRVTEVFREVFGDDELVVDRSTTANDIVDWDSLLHVTLVLAIEKEFSIRMSSSEVTSMKDVGDFLDLIQDKM